jgi:hypothetical protein
MTWMSSIRGCVALTTFIATRFRGRSFAAIRRCDGAPQNTGAPAGHARHHQTHVPFSNTSRLAAVACGPPTDDARVCSRASNRIAHPALVSPMFVRMGVYAEQNFERAPFRSCERVVFQSPLAGHRGAGRRLPGRTSSTSHERTITPRHSDQRVRFAVNRTRNIDRLARKGGSSSTRSRRTPSARRVVRPFSTGQYPQRSARSRDARNDRIQPVQPRCVRRSADWDLCISMALIPRKKRLELSLQPGRDLQRGDGFRRRPMRFVCSVRADPPTDKRLRE